MDKQVIQVTYKCIEISFEDRLITVIKINTTMEPGNERSVEPARPSFESIYMSLAELMSKRSTCKRLQVGSIMTSTDFRKVLAVGYNGNASGLPNMCDSSIVGSCGDLHAEANLVINCDTPRYVEKYVFVTHTPCINCAKMLINVGNVKRVYYKNSYRDMSSIGMMESVGIEVIKLD